MQEFAYAPGDAARHPRRKKARKPSRAKTRYTNQTKVILCYLIAWSLAALLPLAGLAWVFPYTLVGTAPAAAENLAQAVPALAPWLGEAIGKAAVTDGMAPRALSQALSERDLQWRLMVGGMTALLWLASLLVQLIWRSRYMHPLGAAKAARRAVRTYRLTWLGILLLNGAGAYAIYVLGMQFIGGRTFWDWVLYFGGFGLNALAALVCFRLAAPPAISGKHAFFKRL